MTITLKTGPLKGTQWDNPQIRSGFYRRCHRWRPLTSFCFLYLDGVSVTAGTVRQYLDPTEAAHSSLTPPGWRINMCHCQKGCCVSQQKSRAWRRFQEKCRYSRRAGQASRSSISRTGICSSGRGGTVLYKTTSSRCEYLWSNNEGDRRAQHLLESLYCGTWLHLNCLVVHWCPVFHRWQQVHSEHRPQTWRGLKTPWITLCCL